jgi:hypothetical protein
MTVVPSEAYTGTERGPSHNASCPFCVHLGSCFTEEVAFGVVTMFSVGRDRGDRVGEGGDSRDRSSRPECLAVRVSAFVA